MEYQSVLWYKVSGKYSIPLMGFLLELASDGANLLPSLEKMTVDGGGGIHRREKMTNLFGSSFLSGFLFLNRGTQCFPKDRKVNLVIMLK